MKTRTIETVLFCVLGSLPAAAWAGMPYWAPDESTRRIILTDAGRLRWEAISFFLAMLLLSALAVRWLWNWLSLDFPKLPRLSYGKAVEIVFLWGMLLVVVLTMIAAAREMMTPGVWKKQGLLYTIPAATAPPGGEGAKVTVHARANEQTPAKSDAARSKEKGP
jgi:hypothetical protein